jgi:glutamine amidotransferase-like uncharacterized protein
MRCALKTLKLYTHYFTFFVMNFAISNSTAIEAIALEDNTATVTFNGGRDYDYTVNDVTAFVTSLTNVIEGGQSVGRFVNQSVKNETLQRIAA